MQRLRSAGVEIQPDERRVLVSGKPVSLGARAFDLLMCLLENRDRVVSKADLLDRVWPGLVVEESNLTVHVAALRKCLGPQAIATVSRRGYRFTAELAVADSAPSSANTAVVEPAAPVALPVPVPPPDKPSLAVMPFANLSGGEVQGHFVDGVVDDITTALLRVRAFFVIARSSSFTYKGRVVDAPQVGRDLDVHYLVEGSFRQAGARAGYARRAILVATRQTPSARHRPISGSSRHTPGSAIARDKPCGFRPARPCRPPPPAARRDRQRRSCRRHHSS